MIVLEDAVAAVDDNSDNWQQYTLIWFTCEECLCVCSKLYKRGQFAEAYSCGAEAMKIHSGNERANQLVAEIRNIVCKFSTCNLIL